MSNLANTLAGSLRYAADAVDALGASCGDYRALTDTQVYEGQQVIAAARQILETRTAWLAGEIATRSRWELGDGGLSRRKGFTTPELMV
ncbi:hypothetical protein RCH23_002888 [Cryobacterium sp. CAN_C3]|uniref:hypothetical protein n=1 Tax=unclassified Cryobacterium TaxID=2649013 RepID=UPI0018CB9ADF|nr:hypothetical protein [Cryobacterium sp. CAN_C3]MEC5155492.1 hypothetical protein [Cryobacterium sp. CAN_C3]